MKCEEMSLISHENEVAGESARNMTMTMMVGSHFYS